MYNDSLGELDLENNTDNFVRSYPRSIREYDLVTAIAIYPLTQYLMWKMGSSIFAAMSLPTTT